jgi:hypothetical protein
MMMEDFRWFEALFVSWKGMVGERERKSQSGGGGGLDINFYDLPGV